MSNSNVGFWGILQLVFIVLKFCNTISWSWWLVLAPIEMQLILIILLYAIKLYIHNKVWK
mgnify:FL=1